MIPRTLDRKVAFDERSREFRAVAGLEQSKLRSYTWNFTEPVYLDQGREGACFLPNTMIRMADGSHKAIQDIRLLDEVVTAEGNVGKVLQTMVRRADKLLKLDLWGHRHIFSATPEHPILIRQNMGSEAEPDFQNNYVPLANVKLGDMVCLTKYTPEPVEYLEIPEEVRKIYFRGATEGEIYIGGVTTKLTKLPDRIKLTSKLGRLLGLYAAEGHTTENKVTWSFSIKETDTLVADTVALIRSELGAEARIQKRPNNVVNVVLYGKPWRRLFEAIIPGTTKHGDKKLSNLVTCGSNDYLTEMLEGWLDGDGHRRDTSVEGVSVSHQLTMDFYAIAQSLGKRPVINRSKPSVNEHAKTRQDRWSLKIAEGNGAKTVQQDDKHVWRKVAAIEEEPYDGYVYNFHVEGDESYVAEGIAVHNCVAFAWCHELLCRPAVVEATEADAIQLYHRAQRLDQWEGEDYSGTSVLAGAKAVRERLNAKGESVMESFRWVFGLEDLIRVLGLRGPVVLGLNWYMNMYEPDEQGFIHANGGVTGGHAILARGVKLVFQPGKGRKFSDLDFEASYVLLRNSWGEDWGLEGDCKISLLDMDMLLRQDGEGCVPLIRRK